MLAWLPPRPNLPKCRGVCDRTLPSLPSGVSGSLYELLENFMLRLPATRRSSNTSPKFLMPERWVSAVLCAEATLGVRE